MRLSRKIALLLGALSILLVGVFGPLFAIVHQHTNIYNRMLIDTRLAVENVFNLEPVTHYSSSGHSEKKFRYLDFKIGQPETYRLKNIDKKSYFQSVGSVQCFIDGTNWKLITGDNNSLMQTSDKITNVTMCACLDGWYGVQCSIPGVVMRSMISFDIPLNMFKVRENPRRIVHALNVNRELDMFEVRVNELEEAVDVYLICESNFSAFGDPKPLFFLDRFRRGFLHQFQHKIVYIFQDSFPEGGREDGWIADGYQRTFLGQQGIKQLSGLRNDDLFVLLDADEIPKKEILLFLKLHDGFNEPIRLNLRWTVFGFFWKVPNRTTEIISISSIAMLHNAMGNDAKLLRTGKLHPSLSNSFFAAGGAFQTWTLGEEGDEAGWHCSWCFDPEDIRWKLNSAQNGDKPRWGDYAKKKNLTYIKGLIRTGTWFNDVDRFDYQPPKMVVLNIPQYVLQHPAKFRSLLVNLYDERIFQKTLDEFQKWFGIA
uniref:Beta-1,4-mannosyl-glycoprotein 4-beta-N-acetylglucosaminyltransferase n=1 Tax=Strigamia maritima TaxID=126957 RepID=T1JEH3_STRMM